MSDQGICLSRGLASSGLDYKVVPLDKVADYLTKHHNCYEITLPIQAKGSEEVVVEGTNRPYIDLDGLAPADWDEDRFDRVVDEIVEALEYAFKGHPYSLTSASQHASKHGNKLSFHITILDQHGSRSAVKKFVEDTFQSVLTSEGLGETRVILKDEEERFKKEHPSTPYVVLDMSIYGRNRKMRCWNSTKDDEARPLVMVTDQTPLDTLITYIPEGCERLPEPTNTPPPPQPTSETSEASDPKDIDEAMPDKIALLREVLSCLNIKRVDIREYWIRMGFALHNEGVPVDVWVEASKRSSKFAEGECERLWNGMVPRNLTQSLLWLWLREDNPLKYAELNGRRTDFWQLLRDPVAFPSAQFFANCRPDQYLYHGDLGWFQKRSSGAWQLFKKGEIPDGLNRDIWVTFNRIAKEHLARLDKDNEQDAPKIKQCLAIQSASGNRRFVSDLVWALPSFYLDEDLPKKMDESRHLFAFNDKVVDLDTGEVRPIAPHDFVCITTGYDYPKKSNPEVRREIRRVLRGLWDCDAMVEFVLLVLAMSLYGKNLAELFYLWKGKGGNGKGLLAELLKKAFGNYFHGVPIATFVYADNRKDATNDNIVNSKGKRFVLTMEPEADVKLQGGFLKSLSGGDEITARGIYAKPITFTPQYSIHIQVNVPPPMSKMDDGVRRRLVVLPFPFQFRSQDLYTGGADERVADANLKDRMSKSTEWRDEFILMLLDAYKTLPKNRADLVMPKMVKEATSDYLNDQNPLKMWLEAEFDKTVNPEDRHYFWSATELRDMFLSYTRTDPNAMSSVKFAEALTVLNGVSKKTMTNNFMGYELNGMTGEVEQKLRKAGVYYTGLRKKTREEGGME